MILRSIQNDFPVALFAFCTAGCLALSDFTEAFHKPEHILSAR